MPLYLWIIRRRSLGSTRKTSHDILAARRLRDALCLAARPCPDAAQCHWL